MSIYLEFISSQVTRLLVVSISRRQICMVMVGCTTDIPITKQTALLVIRATITLSGIEMSDRPKFWYMYRQLTTFLLVIPGSAHNHATAQFNWLQAYFATILVTIHTSLKYYISIIHFPVVLFAVSYFVFCSVNILTESYYLFLLNVENTCSVRSGGTMI